MDHLFKTILGGLTPEEALRRNRQDLLRRIGCFNQNNGEGNSKIKDSLDNRFKWEVSDKPDKRPIPFSF